MIGGRKLHPWTIAGIVVAAGVATIVGVAMKDAAIGIAIGIATGAMVAGIGIRRGK